MAKVQQKSEKITAFGGIFFVLDKFDSGSWGRFCVMGIKGLTPDLFGYLCGLCVLKTCKFCDRD